MENQVHKVILATIHFFSSPGTLPPFHDFYATYFNMVDRFNRYFYKLNYSHKHTEPGPVRIWSLLNIALVQSWAYYCEVMQLKPKEYHLRTFVKDLLAKKWAYLKK
jgi:hypothetical protein